jgi:hypothetical protein
VSRRKRRTVAAAFTQPTVRTITDDGSLVAPGVYTAPIVPVTRVVAPPQRKQGGGYTWSLETIRAARDAQMRGQFDTPVRMAEAFRTNDAMFVAYQTRVSTQSAIKLVWRPADTDAGRVWCERAECAIQIPQHVRESILGTMANHGIAVGYVQHATVDDPDYGPTVVMTLTEWPLEHVRYNASAGTLETSVRDGLPVTITHGDGRWVVFRKFGVAPWTQDACVLPGALVWAAHGGCLSDWAGSSYSQSQAKTIATLREGVPLGVNGLPSAEAQGVLDTLTQLLTGDSPAVVLPNGATAEVLYNGSTAWQVFKELGLDRGKAAQRIYLGTDAALGSQGGAPGVDIQALFNVASTRIQGDLEALERGYREGLLLPWAAMHGVARADMFTLAYAMPDADGERRAAQEAGAIERLSAMVAAMKTTGLDVTQDTVDALVRILNVTVPCTLAAVETRAIPLQLAPTDIAKVVTAREARAAQGLAPFGDERDDMTIAELEAAAKPAAPAFGGGGPPGQAPGAEPEEEPAPASEPEPAEGE